MMTPRISEEAFEYYVLDDLLSNLGYQMCAVSKLNTWMNNVLCIIYNDFRYIFYIKHQ